MNKIIAIPAFSDNYIWCIYGLNGQTIAVVDPGDATPVLAWISQHSLTLVAILITHHHLDHTGGIMQLLKHTKVPVFGPVNENIKGISIPLTENDCCHIKTLNINLQVLAVPGHTLDHIAYYNQQGQLFCGDTLFSAGCGRLFEGKAHELYLSLKKLIQLPDSTEVYCTHEYTLSNLMFARQVEPDNPDICQHIEHVKKLLNQGKPSLPSTIGLEKRINPFLRCDRHSVILATERYCGRKLNTPAEVFAQLRHWKDQFVA